MIEFINQNSFTIIKAYLIIIWIGILLAILIKGNTEMLIENLKFGAFNVLSFSILGLTIYLLPMATVGIVFTGIVTLIGGLIYIYNTNISS